MGRDDDRSEADTPRARGEAEFAGRPPRRTKLADRRRTPRPDGRAEGVPILRAVHVARGSANDSLRMPLDVIAGVHGDGELPIIPLVWDSSLDVRARFVVRDGVPSAIAVRPGKAVAIPVIHEVGHLLDFGAIDGEGDYASAGSPVLARWLTLAGESPTVRRLDRAVGLALQEIADDEADRRARLLALTDPEELWARSYTQYVIRRSGRADLFARLEIERVGVVEGFELPLHWSNDEFVSIDGEIERVFRSLGWRTN